MNISDRVEETWMAGIRNKLIDTALGVLKPGKKLDKDPAGLMSILEDYKEKRRYQIPEDYLNLTVEYRIEIVGERPCLIASPIGTKPKRALLFFYGGGYYRTPDRKDFEYLVQVVRRTQTEVWFPLYPLAPEADISMIMEHAVKVYREILKTWHPQDIVWQGNSSGGTTCIYLCMKLRHDAAEWGRNESSCPGTDDPAGTVECLKKESAWPGTDDLAGTGEKTASEERPSISAGEKKPVLPYPSRILLLSPAIQMPPSEEQIAAMKELEKEDHILSVNYCRSIAAILEHPDYAYLKKPFDFDWSGFPPMMILYGTKEIFSVYLPEIRETAGKYKVPVKGVNGKDRMHCWPLYGNDPESVRTVNKMLTFIQDGQWTKQGDPPDGPEEFICIFTAADDIQARMVEELFRANEIPCFRKDKYNADFMNVYGGNSKMGTEIFISSVHRESAESLLNGIGLLADEKC